MYYDQRLNRSDDVVSMIEKLMVILPYADHWYEGKSDKEIYAMYKQHRPAIVQYAIEMDAQRHAERMKLWSAPAV